MSSLISLTVDNITVGVADGVSVVAYSVLRDANHSQDMSKFLLENVKSVHAVHAVHRRALTEDYPILEYGCNLTDSKVRLAVMKRPGSSYFENDASFSRPFSHHETFVRVAIVADPLERLLSMLDVAKKGQHRPDFLRMPVDKHFLRSECSSPSKGILCDPVVASSFLVNYFCGCRPKCFTDSSWAFDHAKMNIINHFAVVGIAEEMDKYIYVLEKVMPNIFKATSLSTLSENLKSKSNDRSNKKLMNLRMNKYLEKRLGLDFELYAFIKKRFAKQKRALDIDR
ncbi:Heparan sulfate 2-O-sulfotransferase 1 [Holothuria leucospilota]|uniref:Heparan sulfate 2-O-sulfotransferase 1 n=1 Tax=Holothuria leucospilota TaxID=206669 RepID=A0A9Q1BJX7_HOLLE|nr:Heparan sulfate 2-O-sulfotransferase 1 [Holothuria leucospilota]